MNIDWKVLSASDGYRLFKNKYIAYRMYRHSRSSKEAHELFMKIIGIAKSLTIKDITTCESYTQYMNFVLGTWAKEQD
jgi:dimeric dUTPase (all-alpha-NTP-PPase superfamily)